MVLHVGVANAAVDLRVAREAAQVVEARSGPAAADSLSVELVPLGEAGGRLLQAADSFASDSAQALEDETVDAVLAERSRLPARLPDGLAWFAHLVRENPRYGLVTPDVASLDEVPESARVQACDDVVRAQTTSARPDITWCTVTGDTPTRLHKVHLGELDGVIEPVHHLRALGLADSAISVLSVDVATPAAGQGAWALFGTRCRSDIAALLATVDDNVAARCVELEHEHMGRTDGAFAVWGRREKSRVRLVLAMRTSAGSVDHVELVVPLSDVGEQNAEPSRRRGNRTEHS